MNKWIMERLKKKVKYISRDYFISCLNTNPKEYIPEDNKRYGLFIAAILLKKLSVNSHYK